MNPIKVYVAGKYSANTTIETLQNIGRGRKVCAELFEQGFAPYCPWHDASFIIDNPSMNVSKSHFQQCSNLWLLAADAIFIIPDSSTSVGTQAEIQLAKDNNIPIFYSLPDLRDYRFQLIQKDKKEIK